MPDGYLNTKSDLLLLHLQSSTPSLLLLLISHHLVACWIADSPLLPLFLSSVLVLLLLHAARAHLPGPTRDSARRSYLRSYGDEEMAMERARVRSGSAYYSFLNTKNTEAVGTENIYTARSFYFRLSLCPFPLSSLLTLCSLLLCVPLLLFRLLLPSLDHL